MSPKVPLRLRRDRDVYGQEFSENEKTQHPHAFEPLMLSVMNMSPKTQYTDVNIISDLNTLRKLFAFAEDRSCSQSVKDEVRINMEVIGSTLFLRRWHRLQSSATQMTLTGCGRGFEEACTSTVPGFEDCTSYHRISALRLGSLACLVQGEADSFMDIAKSTDTMRCAQSSIGSSRADENSIKGKTLRIRCRGTPIKTEDIAEIQSRSIKSDLGQDVWLHLWLSGVTKLLLGKHHHGSFLERNVGLLDESQALLGWEDRNHENIAQFCRVLEEVFSQSLTIFSSGQSRDRFLALVFEGNEGKLRLHRRTEDSHVLPESLESLFEGQLSQLEQ